MKLKVISIYMLHDSLETVASASYVFGLLASASENFWPRPHTFWPWPRSSFSGLINEPAFRGDVHVGTTCPVPTQSGVNVWSYLSVIFEKLSAPALTRSLRGWRPVDYTTALYHAKTEVLSIHGVPRHGGSIRFRPIRSASVAPTCSTAASLFGP